MDCENKSGFDINISLLGCSHEDHPRSSNSQEKTTIYVWDANMDMEVMENLRKVAFEIESHGFRQNCRMSDFEKGGMVSFGVTRPTPAPTFLDKCYRNHPWMYTCVPHLCSSVSKFLTSYMPNLMWEFASKMRVKGIIPIWLACLVTSSFDDVRARHV